MRIAFERFAALTAALATAGSALNACSSDDSGDQPATGGTVKSAGGANSGGKAGSSATGGSHSSGGSFATSGGASQGGASEGGTTGGKSAESGGRLNEAGASWGGLAGAESGGANSAGANSAGDTSAGASGGETNSAGTGGENSAGAAGAPNQTCLGDDGIPGCSGLNLPTDECPGLNPLFSSCYFGADDLRPGVLQSLGACLLSITTPVCSVETEDATLACEAQAAARACATDAASGACAEGISLEGGGTIASPLSACSDGTLTQQNCAQWLSAVKTSALTEVVKCSDPAGEYGYVSSGSCAERLHTCVFPHDSIYPW